MSDPLRLLDQGADEFERELLTAGRTERPSLTRRRGILVGLGLAAAAGTVATGAKASLLEGVVRVAGAPWAIGGALGAAAVVTGASLWPAEPAPVMPPEAPAAVTRPAVVAAAPLATLEQEAEAAPLVVDPAPALSPVRRAAREPQRAAAAPRAPSLSDELVLLESARRALSRGEPRKALALLDDHGRSFRKPRLSVEASVLRIEAAAASGDRARAVRLGREFLARPGSGPYERRIRSLIREERSASSRND